jgi:hypothetical protein
VLNVLKEKWEAAQSALELYHKEHGDLEIPRRYEVPAEEPWSEGFWRMGLGNLAKHIRCRGVFVPDNPERKQWLEERGFRFETTKSLNIENDIRWRDSVLPALTAYRDVHGDLNVPYAFVVLAEEPWPEESWGLGLGQVTKDIRYRGAYIRTRPERRQQLEDMDFVFDAHEHSWQETKSALKLYHGKHGHVNVPQRFVVPHEDPWPEEMWDKRLGLSVNTLRSYNTYDVRDVPERRQWLEEHGFRWKLRQSGAQRARTSVLHYGLEQAGAT